MHTLVKKNNKSGFTLIEVMLAMGIMVIMMTIVWGTFLIINESHANVVVINDAKDYAEYNMQALSNMVANADLVKVDTDPTLGPTDTGYTKSAFYMANGDLMYKVAGQTVDSTGLALDQYKYGNGKNKWSITPSFVTNDARILLITLDVYDNASGTKYYTLSKSIYLMNVPSTVAGTGTVIKFNTKNFPFD